MLLGLFFLLAAWDMVGGDHAMMMQRMTEHNVPMMPATYMAIMVLQVFGGVALVVGFGTRIAALVLAAYIFAISYYLHNFWGMPATAPGVVTPDHATEIVAWVRNLAIVGGLFAFVGFGSGPLALDCKYPAKVVAPHA